MRRSEALHLYEEIMLLALHDNKGTVIAPFPEHLVAGAILAELLMDGTLKVDGTRKKLVELVRRRNTGDPVIDECLEKMRSAKRRASLKTWVSRLAAIKQLRHKVARQLCQRKILRVEEDKILLIFKRQVYPEINPLPEKQLMERLENAIFGHQRELEPQTVVLVSLAYGSDLLIRLFERKKIKQHKKRIKQIANGDMVGKATKEVVEACQTALIVTAMIPAMVATTVTS